MSNFNEWYETMPGLGMSERAIAEVAWRACREEALKILKKEWTGLDLSVNRCDEWYIKQIEDL